MKQIRWNITASADTDQSLRMFLASQGGGRKGDLSRFIEKAVRAHILELSAEHIKKNNAGVSENELNAMVDEAVQWTSMNRTPHVLIAIDIAKIKATNFNIQPAGICFCGCGQQIIDCFQRQSSQFCQLLTIYTVQQV